MQVGDQTKQDESVQSPIPFIGSFTRDMTVASGTQAITGVGFTPSYIICLSSTSGPTTSGCSVGFDNGITARSLFDNHVNNANTNNLDDQDCIGPRPTAGNDYSGHVQSFDSDGFTIVWVRTGTPSGNCLGRFMAFK